LEKRSSSGVCWRSSRPRLHGRLILGRKLSTRVLPRSDGVRIAPDRSRTRSPPLAILVRLNIAGDGASHTSWMLVGALLTNVKSAELRFGGDRPHFSTTLDDTYGHRDPRVVRALRAAVGREQRAGGLLPQSVRGQRVLFKTNDNGEQLNRPPRSTFCQSAANLDFVVTRKASAPEPDQWI